MFRGTLKGSNLRLEEESLKLRLEEELRSFVEPGPQFCQSSQFLIAYSIVHTGTMAMLPHKLALRDRLLYTTGA